MGMLHPKDERSLDEIRMSADEYKERMDFVVAKLDNDDTPDKIKIDILNFLHDGDSMPCKKCGKWFDVLLKLSKEINNSYE